MISFNVEDHTATLVNTKVVEILMDGNVVGLIYPSEKGIKLISAHIKNDQATVDKEPEGSLPIPVVTIDFDPKPYTIEKGKLIRLDQ